MLGSGHNSGIVFSISQQNMFHDPSKDHLGKRILMRGQIVCVFIEKYKKLYLYTPTLALLPLLKYRMCQKNVDLF